jgi:hypothetical protein
MLVAVAQLQQALVRFKPAGPEGDGEKTRGGFLRGREKKGKGKPFYPQVLHSFSTGFTQDFHRLWLHRLGLFRARVPCCGNFPKIFSDH